jgi:N-glycosylase/DNA lyase
LAESAKDGVAVFRERAIHLDGTLASGQTFAFVPHEGGYLGIAAGKPVWAAEGGGELTVKCREGDAQFWRRYFDLDRQYGELLEPFIRSDPKLAACARSYPGMKLLRQPVWEAVNEFIISANNNQRRIEKIYRAISARFGAKAMWEGRELHAYPSPQALAAVPESALRELGAGYRAPYLAETARMVAGGFPLDLDAMDYEAALKHLMRLRGVGEKVADCVLLFSTRHSRAFPVDVWMERVMTEWYGEEGSRSKLKRAAQEKYGELAGIVQQYLFHGARTGIALDGGDSGSPR